MESLEDLTKLPDSLPIRETQADPNQDSRIVPDMDAGTASALSKLFNSDDFKVLQTWIDYMKASWAQPPEVYMQNKDQAVFDSGLRHFIQLLGLKKIEAEEAVTYYAQSNGTGTQETSK